MSLGKSLFIVFMFLMGSGCSEKDEKAPPPPRVDPVTSPTSIDNQRITGSAEYGSTITISDGTTTRTVEADPFTALFSVEIPLLTTLAPDASSVDTTLTLTATDRAKNVSTATTVVITYEPPHPEGLLLTLSRDQITADEGEILATVTTINDELFDLSGFSILFEVIGAGTVVPPQTISTNTSGVARATFSGLTTVATGVTIKASALSLSDTRTFDIVAGRPASFTRFELTDGAADAAVEAGDEIPYAYATADAFGNTSIGAVLVGIDSANAIVLDDGLSGTGSILGLTKTGDYTLTARIAAAGTLATAAVKVGFAQGTRSVDLGLTLTRMAQGDGTIASAIVRDAFGNVILSPPPVLSIIRQDGQALVEGAPPVGDYALSGSTFTIYDPGVYAITATFDDGVNAVAADSAYVLVENRPDLQPPTVVVNNVNGNPVCPATGLVVPSGSDLSACSTLDPPVFQRGSIVTVNLIVQDEESLSRVSYKAFGAGSSFGDFTLVGAGQYVAGTNFPVEFSFSVERNWNGEINIVGQAIDAAGNSANSATVRIPVGIDIEAGGRAISVLASGANLNNLNDVLVMPQGGADAGKALAANADNNNAFIFDLGNTNQVAAVYADLNFLNEDLQFLSADAAGNIYVTIGNNNNDEVWQITTDGSTALFLDQDGNTGGGVFNGWDPEGLSTLGATPARGGFDIASSLANNSCIGVQTATMPTAYYVLQVHSAGTCSNTCSGGALNGLTPNDCVQPTGSWANAVEQARDIALRINLDTAVHRMTAFVPNTNANDIGCNSTDGGNTDDCLVLVANDVGATPLPLELSSVAVVSTSVSWSPHNIANGFDAGLLFAVDRNSDRVGVFETSNTGNFLGSYDFSNLPGTNQNLAMVAAALRSSDVDGRRVSALLGERVFLYTTNDRGGNARVYGFDVGRNSFWELAKQGDAFAHVAGGPLDDALERPYGVVYVPADSGGGGDCVLVSARSRAVRRFRGQILAYVDIDNTQGASLEGSLPLAIGFDRVRGIALDTSDADAANWTLLVVDQDAQAVVAIGRSQNPTDCF